MSRQRRPLGWWDDGWNGATETRKCGNHRKKILDLMVTLQPHADYKRIFDFTWSVLNLASAKSAMGQEQRAGELQKRLLKALKKIASGSYHRQLPASELSLSEDNTTTKPTADDVATKDT